VAEAIAVAHPRDVYAYEGGETVEAAFVGALARGRLHHGWLLTGPEGIGKATFAYRAARRLLGAAADPDLGLLGASPQDRVSRQVAARSHPDLMVLERVGEDGKARKVIPVDDARRLPEFFSKSPSMGGYRVAIVDAVDDMNPNAANALLKTLEEPPERGVLFLISHAPGGLLPTIRSRCRRLRFDPWPEAAVAAFVQERTEDQAARELIRRLPEADTPALQALADSFRGPEGMDRFTLLFDRLSDHVRLRAELAAEEGSRDSDRWAEAWSKLAALPREVEGLNLDRADAFWSVLGDLRAAART
jgi:DNA polymerase-3 subunit delta'